MSVNAHSSKPCRTRRGYINVAVQRAEVVWPCQHTISNCLYTRLSTKTSYKHQLLPLRSRSFLRWHSIVKWQGLLAGASEAILLCVTNYVTGALILNRFVCPREKITQMRSSIHSISKSTLDGAISQGQALSGWEGARSELWKYIDDNTILVGHALEHDLDALRIIHPHVVDSGILLRNAVGIRRIR